MQKNILKVALSLGILVSVGYLGFKSAPSSASDTYVKVGVTHQQAQKLNIYGVQPVSEIVGDGGEQLTIGVGKNIDQLGNSNLGATVGAAYMTTLENQEHILAGQFEIQAANNIGFTPYFGGTVGIGVQLRNGDRFNTSTSANKAAYASGGAPDMTPSNGTFQEDPLLFVLGFEIGGKYNFTKNLNAYLAYDYQAKYYSVNYVLDSYPNIQNEQNFNQRNNGIKAGINYVF